MFPHFTRDYGDPSFASYACFDTCFVVVQVWDMKNLSLVHTISGLHHWVRALVVSQDKVKLEHQNIIGFEFGIILILGI